MSENQNKENIRDIDSISQGFSPLSTSSTSNKEVVKDIELGQVPRTLVELLTIHGQRHLIDAISKCPSENKKDFINEINSIDWGSLKNIFKPIDMQEAQIQMSNVITLEERFKEEKTLRQEGEKAYKDGEVAVLLVAGGQGTRLGYDGPKGCYQALALSKKSLYRVHAEKILYASKKYGKDIPFLVMTSPDTDLKTREYFKNNNYFGLKEDNVFFFCQGVTATCDNFGRALLKSNHELLKNPDGHGGCYTAFMKSNALDFLEKKGSKVIVYIQVDNILAPIDDQVLVGLLKSKKAEIVTKVLKKASPQEKVGHLVSVNGQDQIVEYVDVTKEQLEMKNAVGEYIFNWGSPAMHAFSVDFFKRLKKQQINLPFHQSKKFVKAYIDGMIQDVEAYKHEKFIFDLLPLAKTHIGLEIKREDEFSPIKNSVGNDSVQTALELYSNRNKRWLRDMGVDISLLTSSDYVEIDMNFAPTYEDFKIAWDNRFKKAVGDNIIIY